MKPFSRALVGTGIACWVWFGVMVHDIQAASSCVANVTPAEVAPGEQVPVFTYSITNTGESAIVWIKIQSPHPEIQPWTVNLGGWNIINEGNATILDQRSLASGGDLSFSIETTAVPILLSGFTGSWQVMVSEHEDGSDPAACTGSLGFFCQSRCTRVNPSGVF